jgi:D-3-phosphoglycerate dehydrogenase
LRGEFLDFNAAALKKVVCLESTDPLLESGLTERGYGVERHYTTALEDLPLHETEGVVVRSRLPINADFLERAPQLRWIMRLGAGLENIDLEAAEARGIVCIAAAEGNATAVGEHTVGLLLGLRHRIAWSHREIEQGLWLRSENKGDELENQTVAVVGFGPMGAAFAQRLCGFGCRVLAYDKYKTGYAPKGVEAVDWATVEREATVVSLHLPLTSETRGLVTSEWISRFAHPFTLLNTSRGAIAPTSVLLRGLESGQLLGVGLDVLDFEKASLTGLETDAWPAELQALLANPRALLTPHIAGWSHQSFPKMAQVLLAKHDLRFSCI